LRRKKKRKTKNLTFKKYEKFIEKEERQKAISAITIQSATDEKPNGGKMKEN